MKNKLHTRQQGPKARVMYASTHSVTGELAGFYGYARPDMDTVSVAVIPCASLREARARVKFERLGWEGKVEAVAEAIKNELVPSDMWTDADWNYRDEAIVILALLGHAKPKKGV